MALFLAFICTAPAVANDLCQWANDGDCDDPSVYGAVSGLCAPGTDSSDCANYTAPENIDNICLFANDGECDDPTVEGHVTSACAPGTDSYDCATIAMEPLEPMEEDPLSDACPPGTIIVDGSCVDEDLLIEEDVPDEK
ncbi:hypothetical protein KUV65_11935 [Maritalea mobilis]|uniref:hypothetical protein n=1 Tax=Maritalea mobilis TaxID=483324 RepID=UPI001C96BC04|nr:hypothetical protein [Maritalea mobilis]MBY6202077.1 hypothetical protein [Maritalea mobilis]